MNTDDVFGPFEAAVLTNVMPGTQSNWRKQSVLPAVPAQKHKWATFTFAEVVRMAAIKAIHEAGLTLLASARLADAYSDSFTGMALAYANWGLVEQERNGQLLIISNPRDAEPEPGAFLSFRGTLQTDLFNADHNLVSFIVVDIAKVAGEVARKIRLLNETGTSGGPGGPGGSDNPTPDNQPSPSPAAVPETVA